MANGLPSKIVPQEKYNNNDTSFPHQRVRKSAMRQPSIARMWSDRPIIPLSSGSQTSSHQLLHGRPSSKLPVLYTPKFVATAVFVQHEPDCRLHTNPMFVNDFTYHTKMPNGNGMYSAHKHQGLHSKMWTADARHQSAAVRVCY